jgi:hypothetical protein
MHFGTHLRVFSTAPIQLINPNLSYFSPSLINTFDTHREPFDSPALPETIRDQPSSNPSQSGSFYPGVCVMPLRKRLDFARMPVTQEDLGIPAKNKSFQLI